MGKQIMCKCKVVGVTLLEVDEYGQEFRCTSGHEETQTETPPLKRLYTRISSSTRQQPKKRPAPVDDEAER
jgi:hypothetical protein